MKGHGQRVYLDFNASTPLAPEVVAAIMSLLETGYGNPSSLHWAGRPARDAVERARAQTATLLGCDPREIVFTSGGTESNNHAIKGVYYSRVAGAARPHLITTRIEHPAVLNPCAFLERLGADVTYLGVDRQGMVDPEDVRRAIRPETILVSVMHANNEVGTVQPIAEIARIAKSRGVLVHTDAAQSVGKLPVKMEALGVDLASVAGHKLYAPKGVGALFIRNGIRLEPLMHGAGHEGGRRAGTENVIQIAGLGEACRVSESWVSNDRVRSMRDYFWRLLNDEFGDRVVVNGHPEQRLPNTLNVSFVGCRADQLLEKLDGIAASTGSACHSTHVEISPVLRAMGITESIATGAVRFSLGRSTTEAELEYVVERIRRALV
jgi:cysteine desulfurase